MTNNQEHTQVACSVPPVHLASFYLLLLVLLLVVVVVVVVVGQMQEIIHAGKIKNCKNCETLCLVFFHILLSCMATGSHQ